MTLFAFSSAVPLGAKPHIQPAALCQCGSRPVVATSEQRCARSRLSSPTVMTAVSRSGASDSDLRIRLYGNNFPITDSIRDYVESKLSRVVKKYAHMCNKVDVHLSVEHNPTIIESNAAEVVVFAGKNILRRQVRSSDSKSAFLVQPIGRTPQ